ncbi:MAG: HD domain-containing protein [Bacteroidales bacterium]|nr:HD domain-containing protein [Bacteroidales bacterium]
MSREQIIRKTAEFARETLAGDGSGHDWWHVYRVWKTAVRIGQREQADLYVVELAALLHDIADWKFHDGDELAAPKAARTWLEKLKVEEEIIAHVCDIVAGVSFKGAGVTTPMQTLEGMVVQDADRLDALGAIGIGRAFAYGGSKGREMHNPGEKPVLHSSFEAYKKSKGPTINHFYEKLLLLKDQMNTNAGKEMAQERHHYMEQFLHRFFEEWDGNC